MSDPGFEMTVLRDAMFVIQDWFDCWKALTGHQPEMADPTDTGSDPGSPWPELAEAMKVGRDAGRDLSP
jgi:hypothetical protein